MIKANKIVSSIPKKHGGNVITAELISDTKEEVIANQLDCSNILGLSAKDELAFGTTCFCAKTLELGMLDSEGTWHF